MARHPNFSAEEIAENLRELDRIAGPRVTVLCPRCGRRICRWRRLPNGVIDLERPNTAELRKLGNDARYVSPRTVGDPDRGIECGGFPEGGKGCGFHVELSIERMRELYRQGASQGGSIRL